MIGYVYIITNLVNKVYVGSTRNIKRRFENYKALNCKSQIKLYNSLKKYGIENHSFEVVWSGDIINMYKYEHLIGIYYECLSFDKGLNLKLPGYNDIQAEVSSESRLKMSISNKGKKKKPMSDNHKLNLSLAHKNKKLTDE